jgi:hypothetical protein
MPQNLFLCVWSLFYERAVIAVSGVIKEGIFKVLQNIEYSVVGINIEALGYELHMIKKIQRLMQKKNVFE